MGCCNYQNNRGDVLGAFDEDFKVKVNAFVDGEDFCRGVRRCLINDLVAGAMDDDNGRKRHCRRGSWI
ncbi:hypothetical protein Q73_14470 [Bacillus coahuilensis m2-6]|uniref:Uncharacterized protein n=1 Tax=Bacillus coahuilensis p1.1.43 TaxID=1150625 RepID=A0A147K401_9BACI|nr:hypothetical protein [Bacillus coahuilensis]KUP04026.1 hypothetical protein Q75_17080 [Bacillus coahuilensis p1.1.43]KUP04833.1 hypothetical protein Q73_14470 [Bacillus coahuilensis m2-6]